MLVSVELHNWGFIEMAINVDDLLRRAVESRASDLHLKVGNHPYLRVDGLLNPISECPAYHA